MKIVYCFCPYTRRYLGEDTAQESPLEPGKWLIPGNATEIAPPSVPAGKIAVFTNKWLLVPAETIAKDPRN